MYVYRSMKELWVYFYDFSLPLVAQIKPNESQIFCQCNNWKYLVDEKFFSVLKTRSNTLSVITQVVDFFSFKSPTSCVITVDNLMYRDVFLTHWKISPNEWTNQIKYQCCITLILHDDKDTLLSIDEESHCLHACRSKDLDRNASIKSQMFNTLSSIP